MSSQSRKPRLLVGEWRARYDEAARLGVPAHITLLFPFRPTQRLEPAVIEDLRAFFRTATAFRFSLVEPRRFGERKYAITQEQVLYLALEPAGPFVALVEALVARYPDTPPYEGVHDAVVPHLSVAFSHDRPFLDCVESASRPASRSRPRPARFSSWRRVRTRCGACGSGSCWALGTDTHRPVCLRREPGHV